MDTSTTPDTPVQVTVNTNLHVFPWQQFTMRVQFALVQVLSAQELF